MSKSTERDFWAKQIAEHAIWEQAGAFAQQLRDLDALDDDDLDTETVTRLVHRGLRLVDEAQARVRGVDPELIPQNVLSNVVNSMNTAGGHVDNIKQQPANEQYVNQLRTTLDGVAQHVMALPAPPSHEDAEVITKAVRRVRETVLDAISTGHEGAKAAEERFAELQQAHEEELRERDQRIAAANERVEELEAKIESATTTAADQQAALEKQLTDSVSTVLDDVNDLRKQARESVSAAAADVIGGGYADVANKQKEQADNWRKVAVAFGTIAALVAIASLFIATEVSTSQAIRSAAGTLALVAVAGYAGRQSGIHRRREEFAIKASLELATLEPYLATLPDEARDVVRATHATHFFTQPLIEGDPGEDQLTALESLVATITKSRRAAEEE